MNGIKSVDPSDSIEMKGEGTQTPTRSTPTKKSTSASKRPNYSAMIKKEDLLVAPAEEVASKVETQDKSDCIAACPSS